MATEIFVFGSNLAGRHGKGAARDALRLHGAVWGRAIGRQGNSYAIPTKSIDIKPLYLSMIAVFVGDFLEYARGRPELVFNVTRIGCGLAGYKDEQIAPMFAGAPDNCHLPDGWRELCNPG